MFKKELTILSLYMVLVSAGIWIGCGGPGVSSTEEVEGALSEVRGAIVAANGSQKDMHGFIMVMVERDTGISRVSTIDSGGLYNMRFVKAGVAHTMILLSKSYKVVAVLSIAGTVANTVRQYFVAESSFLPRLIHRGAIIQFENISSLTIASNSAADANGDAIPTGVDSAEGGGLSLTSTYEPTFELAGGIDTDNDKIVNQIDFDLDGDGIINWFDIDMNNKAPIDIFDADADSDTFLDNNGDETLKNQYQEGVEFFAVTVNRGPNESGTTETKIIFQTKLREAAQKVWIQAPNSLFAGAFYRRRAQTQGSASATCQGSDSDTDTETETSTSTSTDTSTSTSTDTETETYVDIPYDQVLKDDGCSEDGNPNDNHYGQAFTLKTGTNVLEYQTVFLKVQYGANYFKYYPYVFPNVKLSTSNFGIVYDSNSYQFTLSGTTPFGTSFKNYKWQVEIYDSNDEKVWSSEQKDPTTTKVSINSDLAAQIFSAAQGDESTGLEATTLRAIGYAYSLDKVPGIPAYVIRSAPVILNSN